MKTTARLAVLSSLAVLSLPSVAPAQTNAPAWLNQPLALAHCLDLALRQNSTILKARSQLEAAYGVVVQTRAIAIPKVRAGATYYKTDPDAVETFPDVPANIVSPFPKVLGDQRWSADVRVVQSIYEGGRISSSLRTAKLTKEQALLQYQTVIADTLLAVRVAYSDVLLAAQQITVQEASVNLLNRELEDQKRRFEAGTVPRFNLLRAEVEVANARPRLIRARNSHRIAKNNLVNLLGYNLPKDVWEDIPLNLTGELEAVPYDVELPIAIAKALENRSELAALRKAVGLAREAVVTARALRKPSVQAFAGYGGRNSMFTDDLSREVSGWFAGAQLNWDIFSGLSVQGRIEEAQALQRRAEYDLEDNTRQIELQVRTAYSNFVEARELLDSQRKVQEQAEEALRLATVRSQAGTGTQLDVLSAQTALTEARTTEVLALHDYVVALARLERAIGNP
ncbi:MAG: TolC family protein [Verrucomicrobiia bacterium]